MKYPQTIPYFTLFTREVMLPLGNPTGFGNMVYLFTNSVNDSIKLINNRTNFKHTANAYKYYFYNMKYSGKLNSKMFRINDRSVREKVYEKIQSQTDLTGIKMLDLKQINGRNCFFEMSRYLEIFNTLSQNFPIIPRVRMFWNYVGNIIASSISDGYEYKMVLIDGSQFAGAFSGSIQEKIKNPLFMMYYAAIKCPDVIKNIDCDFLIYNGIRCIKINPYKCFMSDKYGSPIEGRDVTKNEIATSSKIFQTKFRQLLMRLIPTVSEDIRKATDTDVISNEEKQHEKLVAVADTYNFTGILGDTITALPSDTSEPDIESEIADKVIKAAEDVGDDADVEVLKKKADELIEDDKDLQIKIDTASIPIILPKSKASSARDAKIREEQASITVGNTTIGELQQKVLTHTDIPAKPVRGSMRTTNPNMQAVRYANFDKTYNEKVFPSDMAKVFTSLNEKAIPLTVIKYNIEDTSDELNYKDTYTVVLEDAYRQRHTISVDIPKFMDGKFMWIGGAKKIILPQNFLLPVVKSGPTKVQIVTNTNKMFIERIGSGSISSVERINKLIASEPEAADMFIPGFVAKINDPYITTVEYDEFAKKFASFKAGGTKIFFNQEEALKYAKSKNIEIGKDEIFIGTADNGRTPLFIDQNTGKTPDSSKLVDGKSLTVLGGKMIIDLITDAFSKEMKTAFEKIKIPKRLQYSIATTMEQPVALCMLLGFWRGLSYLLQAMNLDYRLEAKTPSNLGPTENAIRFKDCTLVYKDDIASSLIMNGFSKINTAEWDLGDFDTKDPYIPYFIKVYGKANITNALLTNYEFNIDPITKEILEDMKLPTEMVKLSVYANSLLADTQYTEDYNQKLCRIRTNEIIPAILYDAISKQYTTYMQSNGKKKLTIPKNIVIKNLLALKTVEDNSTLNPVLELERTHTVMYRGWRGINSDRTYTQDKRAYDDSMIGIIGPTTSPDGAVGVQKVLSLEPNLSSLRGHTVVPDDKDKLKDVNLFSPAELLCPLAVTTDDPTRVGHMVKQAKHMLPVKHTSPVLISNGAEEVTRFHLSSAFVINADEDGKVVEYNEDFGIMVVEYKSGKHRAINLKSTIEKNGGGGFFLANQLTTKLKVGDTFKKNDMIAWHKDFFTSNKYNGNRMNMGTLAKIAIASTYNTYQDSTFITEKLSEEMATEMVFCKQVVIGKNANIDFLISEGAKVDVGDSLVQFDTSFEDNELNKLLNSLSEDLKEGVLEGSRNDIKSKYAGTIEKIKIYSTVETGELSPSLQKVVKGYYKKVSGIKAMLKKYDPDGSPVYRCEMLLDDADHMVKPNRFGVIRGQNVEDSILVEIYIKHEEYLEVASKVTYFTGLKCTIGEVIEKGYEPYSEFRPDEEVSSFVAGNSVLKRMTPSVVLTSLGNKVIIELKRKLQGIYRSTSNAKTAKTVMTSQIYKVFSALDPSGTNTKRYKDMFGKMSDTQFRSWMKGFFEDEDAYLTLEIVDCERTLRMEYIEAAAKVINIPLYEYVYMPHITMDKGTIVRTPEKVPVGYLHIKRPQQTVAKKNGISVSSDVRSHLTNQVTGADKNGRESDLENNMLVALGMTHTLQELNGPRADDMTMKREMLSQIATQGFATYDSLTNDPGNKSTLNTVDAFFLGMGLKTDLVTKGNMLKSTLKKEL